MGKEPFAKHPLDRRGLDMTRRKPQDCRYLTALLSFGTYLDRMPQAEMFR